MSAVALRVRVFVRHHGVRLLLAALVVGIVAGVSMGLAAGTRRTDTAPDRYTDAVGGDPDLLITQLGGASLADAVAALAGVERIETATFVPSFVLSPIDGSPVLETSAFTGDDFALGARPVSGRFTSPDEPNEFTVNTVMADLLQQRFGDAAARRQPPRTRWCGQHH